MNKFLTYTLSLFLSIFMFAGCNLIELNKGKYYSQTVAQIVYDGNSAHSFTMQDLLDAYNNYGYQLAESGELTSKEMLKQTAELMVQRHMLVQSIKSELGVLSDKDKNILLNQVYKHINTSILALESEVRVEWDMVIAEEEAKEESAAELRVKYEEYIATVEREYVKEVVNGVTKYSAKLVRVEKEEEFLDDSEPGEFIQTITDEDVSTEAWKRYIKNLKENAEAIGLVYTDEEVFDREIEKIYNVLEENKYISLYQENLSKSLEIKTADVVNSYKEKYKRDYELYYNNEDAYHTAMSSNAQDVYYHPNSGDEYVYVTHILFKFSDEQTAEIERLEKLYKSNSIEKSVYDVKLKEVQNIENTVVSYEENGEVKQISAQLAYYDILNNVSKYDKDINFVKRAEEFNKFLYKYNDDEGIMNSDFAYVVNLDTKVKDKMVKPFANESRRLHQEGKGSMSEPILTDYGYHVILNLGQVVNVLEPGNIDNLTWEKLYNTKTQPSSNKTLFHVEYDALEANNNAIANIMNSKISDLTAQAKVIKYWEKRYLTLLKEK